MDLTRALALSHTFDIPMNARTRLRAWIRKHTNQRQFAGEIGIHETYLSQVLSGVRTPRLPILAAIERETGIPLNAWLPSSNGDSAKRAKRQGKSTNVGA